MGVNSLPKTVTRQRRSCDLNPGPSAPQSSTLTTRLPSHPVYYIILRQNIYSGVLLLLLLLLSLLHAFNGHQTLRSFSSERASCDYYYTGGFGFVYQ